MRPRLLDPIWTAAPTPTEPEADVASAVAAAITPTTSMSLFMNCMEFPPHVMKRSVAFLTRATVAELFGLRNATYRNYTSDRERRQREPGSPSGALEAGDPRRHARTPRGERRCRLTYRRGCCGKV